MTVIFSFKTGKIYPVISQSFLPSHASLDRSGSLLISKKTSFRTLSGWENNWTISLLIIKQLYVKSCTPNNNQTSDIKNHTSDASELQSLLYAALLWPYMQAVSPSAGKGSPLWATIENMQRGLSFHWTKPFLIFEARYFQATTLGLPVEISKYYQTVNGITVNGEKTNLTANKHFTND